MPTVTCHKALVFERSEKSNVWLITFIQKIMQNIKHLLSVYKAKFPFNDIDLVLPTVHEWDIPPQQAFVGLQDVLKTSSA